MTPGFRSLLSAVTVAAATVAGAVAVAAPAGAAPTVPAPGAAASVAVVRTVSLITGDVVQVRTGGRQTTVTVVPRDRHGAAGVLRTVRRGDAVSVIPAIAEPYLGRLLDPALFDVTALAAAPAGRLPVQVAYRPGAVHRALPGVTVTATSGDTSTGFLTAASARRFGQALAAQVRADAAAGWPRSAGLFAGIGGIRFGGPVGTVVQPRFPMVTLRVKVLDGAGKPAQFGSLAVLNVDDQRKYEGFPFVEAGETRVSVPKGNYSLLAEIPQFGGDGSFSDRLVNVSDFAVTAARTITVDARTATVPVGVRTPRPATADEVEVDWVRGDALGVTFSAGFSFGGADQILVAPGRRVVHGRVGWSNRWHLSAADNSYTYDLKFDADGAIPTQQRFVISASQLAALRIDYHSDVPSREINTVRFALSPPDYFAFQTLFPVTVPTTRTEYVGGSPGILWQQSIIGVIYSDETTFVLADFWSDGNRTYRPGDRPSVSWFRAPLHPGLDTDTGSNPFYTCPACRSGNTLKITVSPLVDSTPGHVGSLDSYGPTPLGPITASTRFRLYRGSTLLTDQRDVFGAQLAVPAATGRYRLVYDQDRAAPWIRLGTRSHTEWGFASARPATRTAPAGWDCPAAGPCAVLPLLVPSYDVPVDQLNRAAPGRGTVTVSLSPNQGARNTPITAAGVQWSTDDGHTWTTARVRPLGAGRYAAAVVNPAGGTVSLRLTGRDSAGNTLTQTLVRAYAVR